MCYDIHTVVLHSGRPNDYGEQEEEYGPGQEGLQAIRGCGHDRAENRLAQKCAHQTRPGPDALVAKAKASTGVQSDTELIEVALANLAVADEYPDWLLAQRGTVNQDIDIEF
ncbi:MAG: hypothetical protein WCC87_07230 [Candidatus Korobacteraceae bacterium]